MNTAIAVLKIQKVGVGERKLDGSGIETFIWLLNAKVC